MKEYTALEWERRGFWGCEYFRAAQILLACSPTFFDDFLFYWRWLPIVWRWWRVYGCRPWRRSYEE